MDKFFSHENQPFPPSCHLSARYANTSDLMTPLEPLSQSASQAQPNSDIYHGWRGISEHPQAFKLQNLQRLCFNVCVPYINRELQQARRVDSVWDQWFHNSFKVHTRESRVGGPSRRRRVEPTTPVPKNWQQSLRVSTNRIVLFKRLSNELMMVTIHAGQELVNTDGEGVHCNSARNTVNVITKKHILE